MLFVIWAMEWKHRGLFKRWLPVIYGILFVLLIGVSRVMLGFIILRMSLLDLPPASSGFYAWFRE